MHFIHSGRWVTSPGVGDVTIGAEGVAPFTVSTLRRPWPPTAVLGPWLTHGSMSDPGNSPQHVRTQLALFLAAGPRGLDVTPSPAREKPSMQPLARRAHACGGPTIVTMPESETSACRCVQAVALPRVRRPLPTRLAGAAERRRQAALGGPGKELGRGRQTRSESISSVCKLDTAIQQQLLSSGTCTRSPVGCSVGAWPSAGLT